MTFCRVADLAERGCRTLALDVTDEQSMRAGVAAVEKAEGAVGVLVNNAGHSLSGAGETLDMDDVRRQFETNVFGLIRMCQRYPVTPSAWLFLGQHAVLTDRMWDAVAGTSTRTRSSAGARPGQRL